VTQVSGVTDPNSQPDVSMQQVQGSVGLASGGADIEVDDLGRVTRSVIRSSLCDNTEHYRMTPHMPLGPGNVL